MRILGAVFFPKSFGGKIRHIRTDVTDQAFFKKWRMRIKSARIFFF